MVLFRKVANLISYRSADSVEARQPRYGDVDGTIYITLGVILRGNLGGVANGEGAGWVGY